MFLVTGGTGLVGSNLLYQLSLNNDSLVAIHRDSSDLSIVKRVFSYYTKDINTLFDKIIWKQADITDISALQKVFKTQFKHVYHCAAMISFNSGDYYKLRTINIQGTANLVNFSLEKDVEKFCFVSSIATLDEHSGQKHITEESEWNPELKHHGYAITKYGAEMEAWRASQEGLDVIIVNPGVILGAGLCNTGSGKLFSSIAKGFKYYTEGITGFVDVRDVVKSMINLMSNNIKNERFILVAENKLFKEVIFQIADNLGVKRPSYKINKTMTEIAWRIDWVKSLFGGNRNLTKYSARSAHHRNRYSSEKVKKVLGFQFQPVEETIARTCKIFKKEDAVIP